MIFLRPGSCIKRWLGDSVALVHKFACMLTLASSNNVRLVIVFDGLCNICNGWVSFVSRRDYEHKFSFASAQSKTGQHLLQASGFSSLNLETMLLVTPDCVYSKSDAVIGILSNLGGAWRCAAFLRIVPSIVRDFFYSEFAKRRYALGGRRSICQIPGGIDATRFLP